MSKPLVSDELWARIEPLLPAEKPRRFRFPGRKPKDRRKILTGIVFVLKTGIAWDDLPAELGWGCGRTCRETLAAWQRAGVWDRLHKILLDELGDDGLIDWSRTLIDSAASKAPKGGDLTGPNPTDRRKKGSKHHVITDAQGIPLAIELTGAQRHDSTQMLPLVDAIPPIQGKRLAKPYTGGHIGLVATKGVTDLSVDGRATGPSPRPPSRTPASIRGLSLRCLRHQPRTRPVGPRPADLMARARLRQLDRGGNSQDERSCHPVPFDPPVGTCPENGAWRMRRVRRSSIPDRRSSAPMRLEARVFGKTSICRHPQGALLC
jgi:transposase